MLEDRDERDMLGKLACGDIPERFCTVVDIQILDDQAHVWLLTNDDRGFERYQVDFVIEDGAWTEAGGSGGFQGGTPQGVIDKARRMEAGQDP